MTVWCPECDVSWDMDFEPTRCEDRNHQWVLIHDD